jgi:UDP-N-acetylmuramoyl-tripeptide--D-alanyl-D-alanine ligase
MLAIAWKTKESYSLWREETMRSLNLNHIAHILQISPPIKVGLPITGYTVDSRMVQPGHLFFALPGAQVNGHAFLNLVAAAGARAAVVDRGYRGPDFGMALLPVDDVLKALQMLAQRMLSDQRPLIVAITGSVGKTTTKEFIRVLLCQNYRTVASPGNQNSQIGLPLTILNSTDGSEELLVLEMGMTMPTQIAQLVAIAPPDIAVITSVALVHAENFASLEAIACAKGEIFSSSQTSVGLLPREVCDFDTLSHSGSCRKRSFTITDREADYRLVAHEPSLSVLTAGQEQSLGVFGVPGAHNRHNLLAAVAVARELKLSWAEIRARVPSLNLPERRLQTVEKQGIIFINDSYNAPPIGVQAALSNLPQPRPGGRRIAVLGTMPELGKFSVQCHREIGEHALGIVDQMFCLGSECQPIYEIWMRAGKPVAWFLEKTALREALRGTLRAGDVVLIKGANGKQMWQLLDDWE